LRISLPPLRDHLEDLVSYVPHFLGKATAAGHPSKTMSRDGLKALSRHAWPRNVRELEHLLYRAAVEIAAPSIGADDVRRLLDKGHSSAGARGPSQSRR